jgi:fumarylacetoacetase
MINATHDPGLRSWVESATPGSDFPIQNLPLGVFIRRGGGDTPGVGVAIGDQILDLGRARQMGLLEELPSPILDAVAMPTLNGLMALERAEMTRLRQQIVAILDANGRLAEPRSLVAMDEAIMRLPAAIGDYTDFYASIFHATRVGELFRPGNPLLRNYKHIPIAYHGRASSIVSSGTEITRPSGQVKALSEEPYVRPSERLDYEVEIGAFVARGNALGTPLSMTDAEHRIFGLCLVNDWSARDIQAWESQPLGPFLSKSFATTISPWVVTYEALAPYRCPAFARPDGDPRPLPYLSSTDNETAGGFDVSVEVALQSEAMRRAGVPAATLSHGSLSNMYWTFAQMLAHHTSNGCNLRVGDLLASGTVSGPLGGSEGCLLEMTRGGAHPIQLPGGETRAFLADGDEVILRGFCERAGYARIGFGSCAGIIRAAAA